MEAALAAPIGSPRLEELVVGKNNIVLIASDHTRPVPSKVLVPPMLAAIRRGNPNASITILIATGCHRGTTRQELRLSLAIISTRTLLKRLRSLSTLQEPLISPRTLSSLCSAAI